MQHTQRVAARRREHAGPWSESRGPGGPAESANLCACWMWNRVVCGGIPRPAGTADAIGLRSGLLSACEWNVSCHLTRVVLLLITMIAYRSIGNIAA